jgi:hypothetical protein
MRISDRLSGRRVANKRQSEHATTIVRTDVQVRSPNRSVTATILLRRLTTLPTNTNGLNGLSGIAATSLIARLL